MDKSIKFLKNASIYFLGNVLTKILAILLIPLYTNLIDSSEYGIYDLVISILSLVIPIIFFQVWDAMFRFVYDYNQTEQKYKIISNGMLVSFISIIIYAIGATIINSFIQIPNIILIFLYGVTFGYQYIYGIIARTFEKNKLYAISGIVNTFFNLVLNVILILGFNFHIEALYISMIVGNIIQIGLIEFKLKPLKNFNISSISKELIIKMLKFSMPIAITTISFWLLTGYSKVVITQKLGASENGIFAIGMKFSTMLTMIVSVLQMSWHEFSFSIIEDKNKSNYYAKGINIFFKAILSGTILAIPFTKLIFPYFVGKDYYQAIEVIPIIYLYTVINSFSGFVSTQFLAEKDSKTTLYSTLIAAIMNVIFSNLLIKYKLFGITFALLISFAVNMIIRMSLLHKKFKISISRKNIIISIIIISICIIAYYKANIIGNISIFLMNMFVCIILLKDEILSVMKGKIKNEKGRDNHAF